MRRKAAEQKKVRILRMNAVVFGVFVLLLWRSALKITGNVQYVFELRPGELAREAAARVAGESVGVPVHIKIPSIAVDAAIEKVALTKDGSMDVPKQPHDTAWYALGPRPGETGSAAIAGHVDWKRGARAVFADLHKVKAGDTITVQDDEGGETAFVVRESRSYDAAADAMDVFTSNDGKAHLNIITCAGSWDKRAEQYTKRLVVFADKVTE